MVQGKRKNLLFPDATKSSYRKAVLWEQFGFHGIRHLTASILYHKGYDVSVIQSILRHKNPTTTNRYLRSLGLEQTRSALEEGLKGPAQIIQFKQRAI